MRGSYLCDSYVRILDVFIELDNVLGGGRIKMQFEFFEIWGF